MEETFSLITGRAGLMCAAPMALVTQWLEHTEGLLDGGVGGARQRTRYSHRFCSWYTQTLESNYIAWKSNKQDLCSGLKWIRTNNKAAFTKYPFSTSLWSCTHTHTDTQ